MPSPLPEPARLHLSPSDARVLRETIRTGSRSFHAASRLLPAQVRSRAFALYAFCRDCDDLIDVHSAGEAGLVNLRGRLARAYAGTPDPTAIDRAFAVTARATQLPKALPLALIEGLAWDIEGRTYTTVEDLHAYAARVAGTVGAMMAVIMGARSRAALARATDLGAAMQLTNIARDVGEDARAGRIYLPLDWLAEEGVDRAAFLADPQPEPGVRAVIARLLDEADRLYARGLSGLVFLPRRCRGAIHAAALVYAEIGAAIRAAGHDSVTRRAVVADRRKLVLLTRALARPDQAGAALREAPPLAANRFLVEAAAGSERRASRAAGRPLNPAVTMLDICLRAETRQRASLT